MCIKKRLWFNHRYILKNNRKNTKSFIWFFVCQFIHPFSSLNMKRKEDCNQNPVLIECANHAWFFPCKRSFFSGSIYLETWSNRKTEGSRVLFVLPRSCCQATCHPPIGILCFVVTRVRPQNLLKDRPYIHLYIHPINNINHLFFISSNAH